MSAVNYDDKIEDKLTLKKLQNHLIKTILGALAVGIVGAVITSVITSYSFYNSTNFNLTELNDNKTETSENIKELKDDVAEIKLTLSNTGIYTTNNKEQIDNLNAEIKEIRKSQEEMMRLLVQINSRKK